MKSQKKANNDNIKKLLSSVKTYNSFETKEVITWCNGCGNYGIQNALQRAFAIKGILQKNTVMVFDVGCSGNGADKIEGYTIHGLHGRAIPLASGIKIGNPNMNIVALAGDGATCNEGINHLIHAVRNDAPIVFLHHNNHNFGLTTGQASSTTPKNISMNSSPNGVVAQPLDILSLVLSLNPSFVGMANSIDVNTMTDVFIEALSHDGFAFVEISQACPTYNKKMTTAWYLEKMKTIQSDHDIKSLESAKNIITDASFFYSGILYCQPRVTKPSMKDKMRHINTPLKSSIISVENLQNEL